MRLIRTLYDGNIDHRILAMQAGTLGALGLGEFLAQERPARAAHGEWLDQVMEGLGADESVLFLDIDCIPLERSVVDVAFAAADDGHVFGAAQVANHADPGFIYAGPMFLCVSRRTWERLGRPSLGGGNRFDVGGRLTAAARAGGVPVDLIWPSFTLHPRWRLANRGCFGIGTFYDGRVFHLFRARDAGQYLAAFLEVGQCVIDGRPVDYVGLYRRSLTFAVFASNVVRKWRGRTSDASGRPPE